MTKVAWVRHQIAKFVDLFSTCRSPSAPPLCTPLPQAISANAARFQRDLGRSKRTRIQKSVIGGPPPRAWKKWDDGPEALSQVLQPEGRLC